MKYFVDFEATQFSEEIISVGCVREDGETFYSLVAPVDGEITPFITNLTGITKEMISEALSPTSVFENFYDWVFSNEDDMPEFFCWGNSDVGFIRHTCKRAESLHSRMALGYMAGSLIDFSKKAKKYLGLVKEQSLLRMINVIDPEAEQNHNALDDALLLKKVYDYIYSVPRVEAVEAYMTLTKKYNQEKRAEATASVQQPAPVKWTEAGLPKGTICIIRGSKKKTLLFSFATSEEAAQWIYENKVHGNAKPTFNFETTAANIQKAANAGRLYYNVKWNIIR